MKHLFPLARCADVHLLKRKREGGCEEKTNLFFKQILTNVPKIIEMFATAGPTSAPMANDSGGGDGGKLGYLQNT